MISNKLQPIIGRMLERVVIGLLFVKKKRKVLGGGGAGVEN